MFKLILCIFYLFNIAFFISSKTSKIGKEVNKCSLFPEISSGFPIYMYFKII